MVVSFSFLTIFSLFVIIFVKIYVILNVMKVTIKVYY